MNQSVVMFPGVGMGHINPIIELGKLFIADGLSVTILILEAPFGPSPTASLLSRVSAAYPSISFHLLPKINLPPLPPASASVFHTIKSQSTPNILNFLKTHSQTCHIRAFILDYLSTDSFPAAAELSIPTYFFCATSASNLIAFLLAPSLHDKFTVSFKDLGELPIEFPGVPPIPASHMATPLMDRSNPSYDSFLFQLKQLPKADGILVNTFEGLEPRAAKVLADGLAIPGDRMPPVYCIGPVTGDGEEDEQHECLTWLDAHPKGSVVFLSFGSMCAPSAEQLREIAVGLERSGQRFLWVVRSPPSEDPKKFFDRNPKVDLPALMPEGFLERTEGRGMIVTSWAPQVAVLRHEAVGAFVSHCGWNSTLEAVCAGVPVIAWPFFAEQSMNKVLLVEEAKLAVAVEAEARELGGYEGMDTSVRFLMAAGLVRAEEVEKKVRWVMEEGGKEIRTRATAIKKAAAAAREEGGSSHKAWLELMSVIKSVEN